MGDRTSYNGTENCLAEAIVKQTLDDKDDPRRNTNTNKQLGTLEDSQVFSLRIWKHTMLFVDGSEKSYKAG